MQHRHQGRRGHRHLSTAPTESAAAVTPDEVRAIAKEAYVYGFPVVDNYRVQYTYFVDKQDPQYKGVWNQVHSAARVFTPRTPPSRHPTRTRLTPPLAPIYGRSRWC